MLRFFLELERSSGANVAVVNTAAIQLIFEPTEGEGSSDGDVGEHNPLRLIVRERAHTVPDEEGHAGITSPERASVFTFDERDEEGLEEGFTIRTPKTIINTSTSGSPPVTVMTKNSDPTAALLAHGDSQRKSVEETPPSGAVPMPSLTPASSSLSASGRRLPMAPNTSSSDVAATPLLLALAEVRRNLRFAVNETQVGPEDLIFALCS